MDGFFDAGFGLFLLILAGRVFGYDATVCRTVSIEVGMQNSGLGTVLAKENFPLP